MSACLYGSFTLICDNRGAMTVIRYSAGKLLGIGLLTGALAGLWLWMLLDPKNFLDFHGRYAFLVHLIAGNEWLSGGLFALCFGITALLLSMMLGDRLALAIGPDGVEIRTLLGRHRAGWDRVGGISIEKAGRMAGGGESLNVRLRQELGEKVVRISTGLLQQSRWEINRLLEAVDRPGVRGGGETLAEGEDGAVPTMDYDAVIARHLAAREQSGPEWGQSRVTVPGQPPRPAAGGFGRKGL